MKRFAIVADKDENCFLADRKTGQRSPCDRVEQNGVIAWKSAINGRLIVPKDQVLGYFAMSEYEFEHSEESGWDFDELEFKEAQQ